MKLFFRRFGEGEPLVIVHGLFGLSDNWVTTGKRLAEHFSVFIPDLRNHGQSQHNPVFTIEALAEDLMEFKEDNHIKSFHLMGHSLGGLVSIHFSMNYPGMVKKLAVVDISLRRKRDYSEHIQLIDAMKSVDFTRASARSDVEKQLSALIHSEKLRQFLLKNVYWRNRDHMGWRLNLEVLSDCLPIEIPDYGFHHPFRGDVLFIRGENSDYLLPEDMAGILEKFPNADLKTISGAGHWVHADAPQQFLEVAGNFFNGSQPY